MLHEIGVQLEAALSELGCPFRVIDGDDDENAHRTTTYGRERIVFEHDDSAGDSFTLPVVQRQHPSHSFVRVVGAKITIYAQSAKSGAKPFEHRRRAEHVLDLVLSSLSDVVAKRKNRILFNGGAFIRPDDLARTETGGGAVYELKFTIDRGVVKQSWAYETAPTLTLGTGLIRNRTEVFGTDPDAEAEAACGGM